MTSGDQDYKDACSRYEKGDLEGARELFSKAIDYLFNSWEDKKRIKSHYYRGCTYYRLGIQCERNQMFEESKKNFENSIIDFEEVSKNLSEKIDKFFSFNYYAECTCYKYGTLYANREKFDENIMEFCKVFQIICKHAEIKEKCDGVSKNTKGIFEKNEEYFSLNYCAGLT